jgi:hypothetical protein
MLRWSHRHRLLTSPNDAGKRPLLRDNAFLVAAMSLPLVVVAFFLLSTALPRRMVPPPTYDLLIRATDTYNQTNPRLMVDFDVRGGKAMVTFHASRPMASEWYTAWFTREHFAESVGWPLAFIVFGMFLIVLSALAFRIDRNYVRVRAVS